MTHTTWTDRDDYEQSRADHHREKERGMSSLHYTVAHTLDVRAAEVAKDIEVTEASVKQLRLNLSHTEAVLQTLRAEERALIDARELLQNING